MTAIPPQKKDLIILVPDQDIYSGIQELLTRPQALQVRQIAFDMFKHPYRDPGCFNEAHEFLRPYIGKYEFALVVFDKDGSGQEILGATGIETALTQKLAQNGWPNRAGVVVIDPELEIWVWSDSNQVDAALGWTGKTPALRDWLVSKGFSTTANAKPARPKEAYESALREARTPKSPAIFKRLAGNVSFARCVDASFTRLKTLLQNWFPETI